MRGWRRRDQRERQEPDRAKLHDAFRAALDEPGVRAAFERYMLPVIPMDSTEYEAFARRTVVAERDNLARLGLLRKD